MRQENHKFKFSLDNLVCFIIKSERCGLGMYQVLGGSVCLPWVPSPVLKKITNQYSAADQGTHRQGEERMSGTETVGKLPASNRATNTHTQNSNKT